MRHGILTIWARLANGKEDAARSALEQIDQAALGNKLEGLHFAAAAIVKVPKDPAPAPEGRSAPAHLVFEFSFDGPRERFVTHLVDGCPDDVDRVFSCCEGYPGCGTSVPVLVEQFLLSKDQGADAAYIAFPEYSVGRIRQEWELRSFLVRRLAGLTGGTAIARGAIPPPLKTNLYEALRRRVYDRPELRGLLTAPRRPLPTRGLQLFQQAMRALATLAFAAALGWLYTSTLEIRGALTGSFWTVVALMTRLMSRGSRVLVRIAWLFVAVAIVKWLHGHTPLTAPIDWVVIGLRALAVAMFWTAIVAAIIVGAWLLLIQLHELFDRPDPTLPSWDLAHEDRLRRMENIAIQNHLVGFNRIKPGPLRLWTLRLVIGAVNVLKQIENTGELSGIATIHFARWVIVDVDGEPWLLFLSNYDGDWDAYLGDFVTEASSGVTAIWSNCVGFPRSWFLFRGGSRDERAFKAYARKSQHETLFRFTAYPRLSVEDIASYRRIRETLGDAPDAAAMDDFMRRL